MEVHKAPNILSVNNLSIRVRDAQEEDVLVRSLSFDLAKGEILGIVGESGSGKSISSLSYIQLLDEQLVVSEGQAIFENHDLYQLSEKEIRKIRGKEIAMIFQEPMSSLNPSMRCGAQVEEMLFTHEKISRQEAKKRCLELFSKTKIPDPERAYQAYPHQLSGGQLQRVMISMAIACNPKILIADECTTALDVTVQKEIIKLLKDLNQSLGVSILFISHDLGVIAEIADRVIVLKKGMLVESGSIDHIFNHAEKAYTKQLIASRPPLKENIKILPDPSYFEDANHNRAHFLATYHKSAQDYLVDQERIAKAPVCFEVKDLVKAFPTKKNFWGKPTAFLKAVNHVSIQIKEGETVGLLGESGCGKSTLSKAMLKLIDADSGDCLYKGQSLYDLKPKALRKMRKDVQYIFQDPYSSLNPRISIGYAIQEPMKVHGILPTAKARKERTFELLELVGLEANHYNRYPHEFSGGQRQRICIARALSLEPKLMVCDEVVSALDVSVQAQVLNLLLKLKEDFQLSMLFVSHDLSVVKFISDRILVMKDGEIVEEGWAGDIYEKATHPYTQSLIASIPGISTGKY